MMRSALARTWASDGAGSKVCELVASGTMPRSRMRSPPMLRAIELMGATVVATSSLSGSPGQLVLPSRRRVAGRGGTRGRITGSQP